MDSVMESNDLDSESPHEGDTKRAFPVRKFLKYGAIALAALLVITGGWLIVNEVRVSGLINEVRTSIDAGDVEIAESAFDELVGVDPDNEILDELEADLNFALRFAEYRNFLSKDELDGALSQLGLASDIKGSPEVDKLLEQLVVLKESKSHFKSGLDSLGSNKFKDAYFHFAQVNEIDVLRFEEAQDLYSQSVSGYLDEALTDIAAFLGKNDLGAYKLATEVMANFPDAEGFTELRDSAGQSYANDARLEAEKLVEKGFYISAFKRVESAKAGIGVTSPPSKELSSWFNPIFDKAKDSALDNDMAVRADSFTGSTSYYYKGTYRTCCGGLLRAADRFNLVIQGKSNPQLHLNVMLYQDNWVFADSIKANIDGSMWTIATDSFFGDSIERDNGNGSIWEYTYKKVSISDVSYFLNARESQKTVIRFQGDRGYSDFAVSNTMKLGVEKILLAYLALGGSSSVITG
jgi:tetratricopeptide (TPR) repeat protein